MIWFAVLIICEHRSTSIDAPIFTILFNFFTSQNICIVSRTLPTVSDRLLLRHTIAWLLGGPSNPIRHSHLDRPALSIVRSERRVYPLAGRPSNM